jgi:hypothetical protein
MDIDLHLQPKRRTVVLVYLGCIAIPFAVAALAYLFRTALAEVAPAAGPLAASTYIAPNAIAQQPGKARALAGNTTSPKAEETNANSKAMP